jgi:hypothetical protein
MMGILIKILLIMLAVLIFNLSYVYLRTANFSKKTILVLMIFGNAVVIIGVTYFVVQS